MPGCAQASRAVYALLYAAMHLGYYISPTKSTIVPTRRMIHLGFGIDSVISSYFLTDKFRKKFVACRSALLERGSASLLVLQQWVGKCNHLRLLFPANSLFTFHCRRLMSSFGDESETLPPEALEEIRFWTFVDTVTEPVPFLLQQHVAVTLYTDASGFGWGGKVLLPSGPLLLRDYWSSEHFQYDICSKEALAVFFALRSIAPLLFRRRVDVFVDNMGLVHAWSGLKSRSAELTGVLRELFLFCVDLRFSLNLVWVSTKENPADAPSRVLDRCDSMLSPSLRNHLWSAYGPFSFDLMALPSNAFRPPSGGPLPFFSRDPFPVSGGTNVFAQRPPSGRLYVFPPFSLIVPLVKLFAEWGDVEVVVVLPVFPGRHAKWSAWLRPFIQDSLVLCAAGAVGALLFPSPSGFVGNRLPLAFGLSAFRCVFPAAVRPPPPAPLPIRRVLFLADSMLRPLEKLSWPSPLHVLVRCFSGAALRTVVGKCCAFASADSFDLIILHAGVNDASRGAVTFATDFASACDFALVALRKRFSARKVVLSLPCLTTDGAVNARVAVANQLLRDLSLTSGFGLISNDNIRITDLADTVHLNAAGTARLYANFLNYLRVGAS